MSKVFDFVVEAALRRAPVCKVCELPTSAAVVNGQRLTAKQLAKFNKARLDKAPKR
jgi:hypothetical protein